MPPIESSKLLTPKDVQGIFSVSRGVAYRLMNAKGFPTIRVGNRLYVTQQALDEWLVHQTGKEFVL
jgi:predicted DNA-binding transcriptional regulator AlpA